MPVATLASTDCLCDAKVGNTCSDAGLVLLDGYNCTRYEDAELLLSDDPTSSHDSVASGWPPHGGLQLLPGSSKGVPCMADELELQAEEIEEQEVEDCWHSEEDMVLRPSVTSLDSCSLKGQIPKCPPSPDAMLKPAWAVAATAAMCNSSGVMQKPLPSTFESEDDSWDDSVAAGRSPVSRSQPRAHHDLRQVSASMQSWAASQQWLRPLQPGGWRGCQKASRCDRQDRHRGICNSRAPGAFFQQTLLTVGHDLKDGGDEALMPGTPVTQRGLYGAEADPQLPLCVTDTCLGLAPAVPQQVAVPRRMSQRRLAAAPQPDQECGSHESGAASSRKAMPRRRSSSEMLDDGSESSDQDELQSCSGAAFTVQPDFEARLHRLHGFVGSKSAHGSDLSDLVPPAKLPRSASATSVSLAAVPTSVAGKPGRRIAAARANANAALKPRKRSGGRGTGPLAATQPGQHCSSCHTQVTPVWRAGPLGPKTLCNACGVRYMKTVKPRR